MYRRDLLWIEETFVPWSSMLFGSFSRNPYLNARKLAGDQFGKTAIFTFEYLPDIFQITYTRFSGTQDTFFLNLGKEI